MAAKSNRKKFLELVRAGQCKKLEKMLEQGLDPNFITEDGSESWDEPIHTGPSHLYCIILLMCSVLLSFITVDAVTINQSTLDACSLGPSM